MGFAATFASVWRDFVTDGVPSSGDHNPLKSDIRALGDDLGLYLDPVVVTANYAARPGQVLWIDTTAGPVTITAAEAPVDPQAPFVLIDHKGTWATNNVTFDPGDGVIAVPGDSDADTLICSSAYSVIAIGYAAAKYRVI